MVLVDQVRHITTGVRAKSKDRAIITATIHFILVCLTIGTLSCRTHFMNCMTKLINCLMR